MKAFTSKFQYEKLTEELSWSPELGIAWQTNIGNFVYSEQYWNNYLSREHTPISIKIHAFRCSLAEKYCSSVLDVGVGCGEFLKKVRIPCLGYDINQLAVKWLTEREIFIDPYVAFPNVDGVTLWDVIEHMPEPDVFLNLLPAGCHLFVSIPVFDDLRNVTKSKHYKLGEHLIYTTKTGFAKWLTVLGFDLREVREDETLAGRENITTFVFVKKPS